MHNIFNRLWQVHNIIKYYSHASNNLILIFRNLFTDNLLIPTMIFIIYNA